MVCAHLENPADFPKPVFIWRSSCPNTPQLIYINVLFKKNLVNIIRPTEVEIENETLIAEFFTKRNVVNAENELTDTLIFPTISFLKRKSELEKFPLLMDEKMFSKELGLKFNGYTYGIGKIVRLAEINNDKLQKFITKYFQNNLLEEFFAKSADCEKMRVYKIEEKLNTLTYGNLVNILRNIIKVDDSFNTISVLSTNKKRKDFRTRYVEYVKDRDAFTHGLLYFKYPEFEPILRIKNTTGKSYYINYSKEIFISNLKIFNYLTNALSEMTDVVDEKL